MLCVILIGPLCLFCFAIQMRFLENGKISLFLNSPRAIAALRATGNSSESRIWLPCISLTSSIARIYLLKSTDSWNISLAERSWVDGMKPLCLMLYPRSHCLLQVPEADPLHVFMNSHWTSDGNKPCGLCWLSVLLLPTSLRYIRMQHLFFWLLLFFLWFFLGGLVVFWGVGVSFCFVFLVVKTAAVSQGGDSFQPRTLGQILGLSPIPVEWSQVKVLLP